MKLRENIEHCYERFQAAAEKSRVILLHPTSKLRSALVARLLEADQYHVLYYAMGPDDISVESVITGMTHDIANQRPLFGRHLNMLNAREQNDFGVLISAFQRELSDIDDKPVLLILDEYDRSDSADDVQAFVEQLAANLPDHCRMVINSRTMPRLPWVSMIAQRRALILLDDTLVQHDFYGPPNASEFELEVYGLGPGFVWVNGKMVEDWEGHLPRLLFFFALDKPVITRSEICRSFWPELDIDQAVNVFHVTKRRLHKALGVDFDVLLHEDGYYRLNPTLNIEFDVMSYVAALLEARAAEGESAYTHWQRVVDFYRGPYLQGHHEDWILSRRLDYRAGYVEALSQMAAIRLAADKPEHALSLMLRAATEANEQEDLHQSIMRLYQKLGRRSEGAAHYLKLVESFRKRGKALSSETHGVYQDLMQS